MDLEKRGGNDHEAVSTAKNLSQDELAEKLYISRQAVSKWENGEATPDIDKLVQLAEIFGVSLDYLVLGKEPEKEIVVEQRGKMNGWEFLNEESKRPLTRGDVVLLIFLAVMLLGGLFIKHYF
ncbi:helix-turn-helix domain-containing protein [Streptococcus suis]|uniref:helix-turn-helix domain-containing protein n=1 Tax=Streptococcus suis TaxID=1307 RepID=UPI000945DB6F|nr:helix-turn-helix transcriptional regulator [Streptococcus suis]MCG9869326.1 helix-turn-helix domain-containing protein [Streptococcus suis]HEL1559773.1 helix-turn-helix transcriptional regulator [Streptococcus suis]HEL1561899.1 helix-turn-helix transcriptional regulator [Streptococcus suis]HEL1932542.1 helix-turn-helix transcriptional regulator [Streptococcus suis]HEL1945005.1 helix-turn-helix transcriptional regulator [Streptococcus suis]